MKNKQKQKTSVLYVFICCLFYNLLKSSCKKIKKISTNVKKKKQVSSYHLLIAAALVPAQPLAPRTR